MALSVLRTFLKNLIQDELGVSVQWANQNLPKQARPFATLRLYGSKEAAHAEIRPSGKADGSWLVVTPTEAVLEVQLFGAKGSFPYDELERLVGRLSMEEVKNRCLLAQVAIYNSEAVQDISGLLDDRQTFETRAAVDLRIRYMKSMDESGYIDTVEIQSSYTPEPEPEPTPGPDPGPEPTPEPPPEPGVKGGFLIYGNIAQDGTVDDLDHAIPIDVFATSREEDEKE